MKALPPAFGEVEAAPVGGPASVAADTGSVAPTIAEPEAEPDIATAPGDTANDWLCAWCQNRVASEKARFPYNGKGEFTFRNPEGIRFEIITFSRTLGRKESGVPTLEHTWFPGYAWSYCQCAKCGHHLGWYYAGKTEFAGLIISRIVRAVCVRN
jgi:hypothetical protein